MNLSTKSLALKITPIPCLDDNYAWVIIDDNSSKTLVVDPGDASPIINYLEKINKKLDVILITHHHLDHTKGIGVLKNKYQCPVYAPFDDHHPIQDVSHSLKGNEIISLGSDQKIKCLSTPGHTLKAISYYFEKDQAIFTGDTLFSLGCGRILEGNYEMLWQSLLEICSLPRNTLICPGHEYTLQNLAFAISLDPETQHHNQHHKQQLHEYKNILLEKLKNNIPSVPTTLDFELTHNPFLQPLKLSTHKKDQVQLFNEIRLAKDRF